MSDYIPEEVVVGILKHLPAKSLVRCRCVCRQWKQLIVLPCLVVEHLALQRSQSLSLHISQRGTLFRAIGPQTLHVLDSFPYSVGSEDTHFLALVGTLHGIVCCLRPHDLESGFYLWNPSVRRSLHVPVAPSMSFLRDRDAKSWMYHAFWIDPRTMHFKILVARIVRHYPNVHPYGAIYSSLSSSIQAGGGGGWKEMTPLQLKDKYFTMEGPSLVMRDRAYWISHDGRARTFENGRWGFAIEVTSFDFEHEKFYSIEGPPVRLSTTPSLSEWKGNLCISNVYHEDPERKFQFYSRQQGLWVHLFSISPMLRIEQVFCLLKETEGNSKIFLARTWFDDLVLYDTIRGGLLSVKGCSLRCEVVHNFVESLVFPG